ncbi:MAG: hypothetical protein R6U29_12665 [Desulfosudaceae bacterium]
MKNNIHDTDAENAKYALLNMFPGPSFYDEFREDMGGSFPDSINVILDYARANRLIPEKTETAFLEFIRHNQLPVPAPNPEQTFASFLDQVLGGRSVNSLLKQVNRLAETLRMAPVGAPMVSRLKKNFHPNTPKKRNLLRLLAFWVGLKRPELGVDYAMLLALAESRLPAEPAVEEKEGVRIAFALQAAGGILDLKAVEWLKSELRQCLSDLNLHHIAPHRISFSLSTAHIDLPKEPGPSGEPRLYGKAIRDSLALAYQMPIRWALSPHSSQQCAIIIGICAGPFDQADQYIPALFSAKKMGITTIRMTDFARLCARLADIKVNFSQQAEELATGLSGAPYTRIWHVNHFWSYLYYDFVPELLRENVLPTTPDTYETFRNELFFPDQATGTNKALAAIRKFPQDSLLAIEVARTLISKRMFHEADEVLSTILASYPLHVVARSCRMTIYHYLTIRQSDSQMAEIFFLRATREAILLERYHPDDSEAHIEAGLVFYTRVIQLITNFRKKKSPFNKKETVARSSHNLQEALRLFDQAATIAPIKDVRAEFWIRQARIMRALLEKDQTALLSGQLLTDQYDIIHDISLQTWKLLGWIQDESPDDSKEAYRFFFDRLNNQMKQYAEEVSVTNWSPSLKCLFAGLLWNSLPEVSVAVAKLILFLYNEAIQEAERLSRFNIGVFSASGCYTLIQSPAHFIRNAQTYIRLLKEVLQDDLEQPDEQIIPREKIRQLALPFALLDDEVESDIILKTDSESVHLLD